MSRQEARADGTTDGAFSIIGAAAAGDETYRYEIRS